MNLRQIEIFCALVRCQTTVAAAHELAISQPAVSNAIKYLEAQLGFMLFDRSGNRLLPTHEALSLYRDAEPLIVMSQAINQRAVDLRDTKRGTLRILSTHALGDKIVPEVISRFIDRRRGVDFFFDVRRMEGVVQAVESGFADIGIAVSPDSRPALNIDVIGKRPMVCIVPLGHPLANKPSVALEELADYPLISLERGSRLGALVAEAFNAKGLPYRPQIEVRHCVTACSLVESGVGVAVSDGFSPQSRFQLQVVPLRPAITTNACVISMQGRSIARLAQRFIRELRLHPALAG